MKRLREDVIDDAKYYERVWDATIAAKVWHFDAVRHRALAKHVKPGDKVLDIGAGVWGTAQYIGTELKIPNVTLLAYDQSYTARDVVKELCPQMIFVLGQLPKLPFGDGEFDVVTSGETIEHMPVPADLAAEMARVCKPGGWITLSTVDTECENAKKMVYPEHVWSFEPTDLVQMFAPFGEARHLYVGDYHVIYCRRAA